MNIENIRNDFPEMPEEIRSMIAQTVAEQVKAGEQCKPVKRNKVRRTAILAFAAALVLGVTALAAGVARLHSQRVGSYGAAVTFAEETSSSESASGESAITFSTGAAENAGVWYDLKGKKSMGILSIDLRIADRETGSTALPRRHIRADCPFLKTCWTPETPYSANWKRASRPRRS